MERGKKRAGESSDCDMPAFGGSRSFDAFGSRDLFWEEVVWRMAVRPGRFREFGSFVGSGVGTGRCGQLFFVRKQQEKPGRVLSEVRGDRHGLCE